MDCFSEEHAKLLLSKEWLAKIDTQKSTPYLFKFYSSTVDLSCLILITDTKSVWAEVMTSNQFARRWRDCNKLDSPPSYVHNDDEDEWRTHILELLTKVHTIGGVTDTSFEVVESNYADFTFELDCEAFKWRWETCFLGHKLSAEIISKHLIAPLISMNHLAFSAAEPVSELSASDLEKAIDKLGRTARRTIDTHVRNVFSKPRVATTLRRMTALFNFTPDLPAVMTAAEKPELVVQAPPSAKSRSRTPTVSRPISPSPLEHNYEPDSKLPAPSPKPSSSRKPTSKAVAEPEEEPDSATESEDEPPIEAPDKNKSARNERIEPPSNGLTDRVSPPRTRLRTSLSPAPGSSKEASQAKTAPSDDSDSSPVRPLKKKLKPQVESSDDDSEEERKRRVAALKSGGAGGAKRGGVRQPIKRGGKRF